MLECRAAGGMVGNMRKTSKQLERYFKGAANHRRIDILCTVAKHEGIAVEEIADALRANLKTISQHTKSLVQAGLLNKTYRGRQVTHALSPYGKAFVKFMRTF
jgi:DNA-binding MarR family transcriptional regulator